jgi:hypothetical protein
MWAFVVALLQVSFEKQGNHPNFLIFNDPVIDSITPEDVENFSSLAFQYSCQIIIIT